MHRSHDLILCLFVASYVWLAACSVILSRLCMYMPLAGTDATMAEHIKTVLDREYASKDAHNRLVPTTLGIALVDGYDAMNFEISLSKPDMRRGIEADLKRICNGTKTRTNVVMDTITKYEQVMLLSILPVKP